MADRNFLVPVNLNKNALNNAVLQVLGTAPGSPVQGQMYYDSATGQPLWWSGSVWTNLATDSAKLNNQSASFYLARANHTGTQTASTISDFDTQVRTSRLDQMAAPTAAVSFNSQQITGLAAGTSATHAINLQQLQDAVAGLSWKDEVRVATTANGTLATAFANGSSVDGITLATNDRILLKNQTTGAENGIYTVNASGAPTRATDADTAAEIIGAAVYVANGTTNGGTRWVNNNTGSITLGTTSLTFASFGGGSTYVAGNGLNLTGNSFSVVADTGISVSGTGVAVDTAVVVRKFAANVGDGSATTIDVTHSLGTRDVTVALYQAGSPYAEVEADVQHLSTTQVRLIFAVAPTSAQYRVVIHA